MDHEESSESSGPSMPPILPDELPPNVEYLFSTKTGSHVYICGTAHVSEQSASDVAEVIRLVQPDSVVLELCKSRVGLLLPPKEDDDSEPPSLMETIKTRGLFVACLSHFYSNVQDQLDIVPGIEFKSAFEEAKKLEKVCKVLLGDRPINVTMKRTWGALSTIEKIKFMYHIVMTSNISITSEDIEMLKDPEVLQQMFIELAEQFPSIMEPLIYERDMFLSQRIKTGILVSI
eukprot:TRINITY_DN5391_c0_g1_i1.p1 TRINITY_DN5391_c0_g1~~TRINITY_DN5391_c0_g1_i1.p1  ORF type:complete len:232 (-),score=63.43 TRINITY_DN5391_c0_g1_i1:248-943(-)